MASVAPDGPPSTNKGKGKAVVSPEPTERTPLLPSSSSHVEAREGPEEPSPSEQRRLMSKLTVVFLISLFVSVVLFVLLALLAYSYASRAAAITPADVLDRALVLGDLHRIEVKNVTENGEITLEVEGRAGLDAGVLIGVKSDDEDGYFMRWWKAIGRWGLRKLDRVTVELSPVDLSSGDGAHLTTVVVQPLELPLTADAPPDSSWLTTISTTLLARPTQNTSIFGHFLRESWIHGAVTVLAALKDATVHGGGKDDAGWRSRFVFTRSDITTMTRIKSE